MAVAQTIGKAGGEFHFQSLGSVEGGGLSRGAGCKTDTSKSLHMGNVSGRGTAVSCEFIGTDNNSGTEPVKVSKVLRLTFFFLLTVNPETAFASDLLLFP